MFIHSELRDNNAPKSTEVVSETRGLLIQELTPCNNDTIS